MVNLNLVAPINDRSYGLVGLNVLVELQKLGVEVSLFPIGGIQAEPKYYEQIRKAVSTAQLPDFNAPCVRLWHEHDMSLMVGNGKKFGWPIFERNKLTEQHCRHLGSVDTVLVCSNWAKSVIHKEMTESTDCKVVPLGVDREVFDSNHLLPKYLEPWLQELWLASKADEKKIFWHQGKIEIRKGHGFLHESFKRALGDKNDWELWISWHNPFLKKEEIDRWERLYKECLGDRVRFIRWTETQEEVAHIVSLCDFGVFPSLSEGWCLPCLEAMSMGKLVICSNYSGFTEYVNNDNACLVQPDELEEAFDGVWFNGGFDWMSWTLDSTEQFIQHIRNLYSLGKGKVNNGGILTAEKFTWQNTAKQLLNVIG